ncbi:MAG: 50S ribosomal protein L11 methyltransferase [Bacteroidota bacterium]|nr:50S ribosomal protein L11 methyltransferase [Bacteroidota bacterium]
MDYIQLTCAITAENKALVREMLMYDLGTIGFESFTETADGLNAYIKGADFEEASLQNITFFGDLNLGTVSFSWKLIKDQNWNEEWEKNFEPVLIAGQCYIRAPFHQPNKNADFDLVIEPKMAFGTGHHETTSLMVEQMLALDFEGKQVLDMGCGTGVLAIMASKLKAAHILAIDIDEWSYNNTLENCAANNVSNVDVLLGDIDKINGLKFDIILANINRNILLAQLPSYADALDSNGILLMSGIYRTDFEIINQAAEQNGFKYCSLVEKNKWVALMYMK